MTLLAIIYFINKAIIYVINLLNLNCKYLNVKFPVDVQGNKIFLANYDDI
jgi:hypothetical protein